MIYSGAVGVRDLHTHQEGGSCIVCVGVQCSCALEEEVVIILH